MQDAAFLMRETKGQQALLDSLLQSKQQLLAEDLPKVCYSIGSLQCLDIIKASIVFLAYAGRLSLWASGPKTCLKAYYKPCVMKLFCKHVS